MKKTKWLMQSAVIAALYVILTEFANLFGLSNGIIQVRFSEALNALACYTSAAVPGLFIGCLLANLLTGAVVWDVIFGSIATLIGVAGAYLLRNNKILALASPVVSNIFILPFILQYAYGLPGCIGYFMITVGIGQIVSCMVLGYLFSLVLDKYKKILFWY